MVPPTSTTTTPDATLSIVVSDGTSPSDLSAGGDSGGIVIQYARPHSAAQMRELELLDAQHRANADVSGATVEHDAAAESVALNSFGAAAAVVQSKKKATLIAVATAAAAAANAVGVPVAAPASSGAVAPMAPATPQTPPRFAVAGYRGGSPHGVGRATALFNGPPADELRLRALLESDTATCTLFVEGLPLDATEREVSHIFRPFDGFLSLRLRPTVSKRDPLISFVLCFVEFDSPQRAAAALDARQAYQFSADGRSLKITFSTKRPAPGTPAGDTKADSQ